MRELKGECLVARARPMGPGWALPKEVTWARPHVGPPPTRGATVVGCDVCEVAVKGGGIEKLFQ